MSVAFVIHAHENRDFVHETLLPPLPSNGFDRWVSSDSLPRDRDGTPSSEQARQICRAIVIVVSRAAARSAAVKGQIAPALASRCPTIVALAAHLDEGDRALLPEQLWMAPAVDFTGAAAPARRELANLLPPPDEPPVDASALAGVAWWIPWSAQIFSEALADALSRHDHNRANALIDILARRMTDRSYPYPPDVANSDLAMLRRDRQFKLMRRYGEAVLASGVRDARVRRQHAQALIEQGEFDRALEVLASIASDLRSPEGEIAEAHGLRGRAYKQQYLDRPRDPRASGWIARAIEAYDSVYREDPGHLWHGVNAASCILRAHRDGVPGPDPARARQIAEGVLQRLGEPARGGPLDVWDCASRVEALLILERYDEASDALTAYLDHPDLHAFEVSSTYRQFDQLLQLGQNPRGRPILDRIWEAVKRHRAGGVSEEPPGDDRIIIPDTAREMPRGAASEAAAGQGQLAGPAPRPVPATADLRPLLIRVTDPDWRPSIPDLVLGARLGTTVSARGSEASIAALLRDPVVISVDQSRPAGAVECEKSIPFIGVAASYQGTSGPYEERGAGALVAIIDDGIDVLHEAFLDEARQSRIVGIWDQLDPTGPPPGGFTSGTYHSAEDITRYVRNGQTEKGLTRNLNGGHGTHVASIAAGRRAGDFTGGVAPEARLLVVISGGQGPIGYSSSHLEALAFIDREATQLGLPVVVNVSQGMNAGAHDGKSALEVAFDEFSKGGRLPGRVIVKSAGNERGDKKRGHAKVTVGQSSREELRWERDPRAGPVERLELWWSSADAIEFRLCGPGLEWTDWVGPSNPQVPGTVPGGPPLMQFIKRHVDNGDSQLKIEIDRGEEGTWRLQIRSGAVPEGGEIHAWIERSSGVPSIFVNHPDEEMTLSIPGTAQNVITVGAVGSVDDNGAQRAVNAGEPIAVGDFSSYGPTRDRRQKPDVCAPGVEVRAARAGTSASIIDMKGTSMAAPHVTGAIALLLSRTAAAGGPIPTSTQIASALRQKTKNYTSRWDRGQGFGLVDVAALLAAF